MTDRYTSCSCVFVGEIKFQKTVKTQFAQNSDDKNISLTDCKIVNYFKGEISGDGDLTWGGEHMTQYTDVVL